MRKSFKFIKKRFFKATQGAISILLALLLVPFTTIACGLLTTARINSAVAIFDEALSNASNSALGTYDAFLKKRFGLLATSQDYSSDDFINDLFKKYLEVNLGSLSNTYLDYNCQACGVFALSDTNILKTQILEFSKYNVPTQIAIDGLNLDSVIASLEKSLGFGSIFSTISKTIDTGSSIVQLGIDYDVLKTTTEGYETSKSGYSTAYSEFSSAVNTFIDVVSAKKVDMNNKKAILDSAEKKLNNPRITELNDEITDLEAKIKEEEEKKKPNKSLITELETELEEKKKELEEVQNADAEANKAYNEALSDYNSAKAAYDKAVSDNKAKVVTEKSEYVEAIDDIIWWLGDYKAKLGAVQNDLKSVSQNAASTSLAIVSEVQNHNNKPHETQKKENEQKIKDNNKKISETNDEELIKQLQEENEYLRLKNDLINKENVSTKNTQTISQTANDAVQKSVDDVSEKISELDQAVFDAIITELNTLKTSVSEYNVNNITKKISYSDYYYDLNNIFPTYKEVLDSEKAFIGNIVKDSAWTALKTILSFIDALLGLTLFYVPELNAVIDSEYYDEKKADVPETGFNIKDDAQLSEKYKELFGDYSADDMDALSAFDVVTSIKNIFTQFGVISSKFSGGNIITSILTLGQTIKDIKTAFSTIKSEISSIFTFISNLIAGSGMYQKLLIAGYAAYMTSNRTTYEGSSPLNSASYNMKGTPGLGSGPLSTALEMITKPASILDAINLAVEDITTKDKCFKGAETEYLFIGSDSEVVNQSVVFWIIYATRLLFNLPAVLTNAEVSSIAAATTIFSPIVYLIVLLLEAFADTLLLVNGEKVPILKLKTVYITPTGMGKFIQKISSLKLSTESLSKIKSDLSSTYQSEEMSDAVAAFTTDGSSSHLDDASVPEESEFLDFDYSKYMFISILIFPSEKKLLSRLSDVIQMECIENQINNAEETDPKFNINRSYTYIRTSASFTTNEFIKLSTSDGLLDTQERIMYRGY